MSPTKRQQLAAEKIVENGGIVSKAMGEVGYSPNTAKTPQKLTNSKGYIEASKPFRDQVEAEIQAAMKHLPTVRDKAGYGEAVGAIEKLKKLNELLGGKPTDRKEIDLNTATKEQIDELLNAHLSNNDNGK